MNLIVQLEEDAMVGGAGLKPIEAHAEGLVDAAKAEAVAAAGVVAVHEWTSGFGQVGLVGRIIAGRVDPLRFALHEIACAQGDIGFLAYVAPVPAPSAIVARWRPLPTIERAA